MNDTVESVGFNAEESPESETLRIEINCVTPPTAEQLERIREFMSERYGTDNTEFIIKRDPSVVAGFKIFVGDDNYDWSVLGRIRQLRRSFQSLGRESGTDKIISLLREDIGAFTLDSGYQQVGFVISVSDAQSLNA